MRSFRCADTEELFRREGNRKFGNIAKTARRKLRLLDAAEKLQDLAAVPGNRFEGLQGDREGQHTIRINDQWRICFAWEDGAAGDVEIVDHH